MLANGRKRGSSILIGNLQDDECYLNIDRRIILDVQPGPHLEWEAFDNSGCEKIAKGGVDEEDEDDDDEVGEQCRSER